MTNDDLHPLDDLNDLEVPEDPNDLKPTFSHDMLGALAHELVLDIESDEVIALRYGLTLPNLQEIKLNPQFKKTFNEIQSAISVPSVKDGGLSNRVRGFLEDALPEMQLLVRNRRIDPDLRYKITKMYADFVLKKESNENMAKGGGAVPVNITFASNIRGMEHLNPQTKPIDVTPTKDDE